MKFVFFSFIRLWENIRLWVILAYWLKNECLLEEAIRHKTIEWTRSLARLKDTTKYINRTREMKWLNGIHLLNKLFVLNKFLFYFILFFLKCLHNAQNCNHSCPQTLCLHHSPPPHRAYISNRIRKEMKLKNRDGF